MTAKILASVAAAAITLAVFILWRGFPWPLALMVALAVGALAYTTWGTVERLRQLLRK